MIRTKNKEDKQFLRELQKSGPTFIGIALANAIDERNKAFEDSVLAENALDEFLIKFPEYQGIKEPLTRGLGGNFAGTTSELFDILEDECMLFPSDGRAYSVAKSFGMALITLSIKKAWVEDVKEAKLKADMVSARKEAAKAIRAAEKDE